MRIWAVIGIAITLLAESAWSKAVDATYKSIKEVCLFSPTVSPANSTLAIQSIGEGIFDGPSYSYAFVRDFKTGLAAQAPTTSVGSTGPSASANQAIFLDGIHEPPRRSNINGDFQAISDGTKGDETNLGFRANPGKTEYGGSEYVRPKFRVSGVAGVGVERNGFVAGFDLKY